MTIRRTTITFRVNPEEEAVLHEGYLQSGYEGKIRTYIRDLILGNIPHQNFRSNATESQTKTSPHDVGEIDTHHGTLLHIQATVLAAQLLHLKEDKDYQKVLRDRADEFDSMVDHIRGYKYDNKTGLKSPLYQPKTEG